MPRPARIASFTIYGTNTDKEASEALRQYHAYLGPHMQCHEAEFILKGTDRRVHVVPHQLTLALDGQPLLVAYPLRPDGNLGKPEVCNTGL